MEIKGKRSLVIGESFGNQEFEHRYLSVYIIKMQSVWDVWWAQKTTKNKKKGHTGEVWDCICIFSK